MRVATSTTKKAVLDVRYTQTAIYTSVSTSKTKNTGGAHSSGSGFATIRPPKTHTSKWNSMKAPGGEDCPMDKGSTKKLMVFHHSFR